MKKIVALLLSLSMIFALSACGSQNSGNTAEETQPGSASTEAVTETPTEEPTEASTEMDTEEPSEDTESAEGKTLVVYYSATGNTEEAANYIAAATGADMLELVPVDEHDNPDARDIELVESTVSDWESYDTVFIGYPIWWGIAAWPVDSFIEANDFTGKTVIPFCTSASSGLGESGELLAEAAGTGEWMEGIRFSSSVSEEDVRTWLDELGL